MMMMIGVEQLSADAHLLIVQKYQQHILLKNLYTFLFAAKPLYLLLE